MGPVAEHSSKPHVRGRAKAKPDAKSAPEIEQTDHQEADHEHGFEWLEVARVAFVALAAATTWFHLWEPLHRVSVIGLAATLIGGYPIFKEAFENIFERRMTMELSMTIALGRSSGHRRVFHSTCHHGIRASGRDSRGLNGRPWPARDSGHARLFAAVRKRAPERRNYRCRNTGHNARRDRADSPGKPDSC